MKRKRVKVGSSSEARSAKSTLITIPCLIQMLSSLHSNRIRARMAVLLPQMPRQKKGNPKIMQAKRKKRRTSWTTMVYLKSRRQRRLQRTAGGTSSKSMVLR